MTICDHLDFDAAGPAPAIDYLCIDPYQWGTECLSGDVGAGPATSFPQALGLVRDLFFFFFFVSLYFHHTWFSLLHTDGHLRL